MSNKFFGIDNSPVDSLIHNGLVFVKERSNEYYCLFKETNKEDYGEGLLREDEIDEFISGGSGLDKECLEIFLMELNMSEEQFKTLNFEQKALHIYNLFGSEELFGKNILPLSLEEALEILN